MDVLSGIIDAAKARVMFEEVREYRGEFREFCPGGARNIHYVASGSCDLSLEGDDGPPRRLTAGDVVVLAGKGNHHLLNAPQAANTDRARIASGRLWSHDTGSDAIYSLLPPILVFNLLSRESMIDLEEAVRIGGAYHEDSGARALASRLIETLVILAAHRRVQEAPAKVHGWVGALLSDPRIGKALQLIHAEPASEWTVERLARQVGMSRTAFSQAFGERVGEAPMAYVLRWRMQVAIDLLRGGRATMTEVADAAGYATQSAFTKAFRREFGVPPAAYAKAIAEANRDAQKLRAARLSAIPSGASKGEVQRELEKSALEFERLAPAAICSILIYDEAHQKLRIGAAPSLPDAYNRTIDGLVIGPQVGSCGTAVYRRQPVITRDIMTSELWADFRYLAARYNLKSCWSSPIFGDRDEILGTFAVYYTQFHEPSGAELGLMDHMNSRVKAILSSHLARERALATV